ncbi:unnamed protein product [Plutella xylostella]|uniref:(diamondback moth) hypothetical protein n=1 Tax=Plutella xylostella TaxID=51655 RepID=A0A8S4F6E9_PLUXY|nr:unnamed protein product [Plutella xylostella]
MAAINEKLTPKTNCEVGKPSTSSSNLTKLPRIEIPRFSGQVEQRATILETVAEAGHSHAHPTRVVNKSHGASLVTTTGSTTSSSTRCCDFYLADQISCELKDEQTIISGICQGKNKTAKKAKFTIYSENNDYSLKLTCCIVSKLTCDLPQIDVDIGQLPLQRSPATTSQQITAVSNFCNLDNEIRSREVDDTLTSIDSSLKQLWRCEQVPQIYKEASSEQELAETMFQESVQLEDCKFQLL